MATLQHTKNLLQLKKKKQVDASTDGKSSYTYVATGQHHLLDALVLHPTAHFLKPNPQ